MKGGVPGRRLGRRCDTLMELHPGKQLFIDDFFIESLVGARRVLNRPHKLTKEQPLELRFEKPWEQGDIRYGDIVYDEQHQTFRMYYDVILPDRQLVGTLTSTDGLSWQYPELGLVEFNGSKRNNITNCPPGLNAAQSLGILWDPHEQDETCRWKRADNRPGDTAADPPQWRAHHSADGYDWKPYPPGPHSAQTALFNFGSRPDTFGGAIDPDASYIRYLQRGSGRATRVLGRRDSPDFLNWSGLRTCIDVDLDDSPGTEFYSASADLANRTDGGLHLMLLHVFTTDLAEPHQQPLAGSYWGEAAPAATPIRTDGWIDTQLAVSRDTLSWTRYREPLIERGAPGAWDWGMLSGDAPIRHRDRLWFFYQGANLTHFGRTARINEVPFSAEQRRGRGVATLRPDGYVSVEAAAYAPGLLTTHRFRQESGGTLRVNVDAGAGELRYELLEDTGDPIPGYTAADSDPIRADVLDAPLSWRGVPGWPAVSAAKAARFQKLGQAGAYIKLRFLIAPGTKLYSVTLDPPEVTMWRAQVSKGVD
jgi:hypothetical protein